MRSRESITAETTDSGGGILLYVTDLVNGSSESLDIAFELAATHGMHIEMIHVVDLDHAKSSPDAQMSIQFWLDGLADSLRHLKRNVGSVPSFGSPEDVIPERAEEIRAKLIAFALNGQPSEVGLEVLAKRVERKAACPVVVLPARCQLNAEGCYSCLRAEGTGRNTNPGYSKLARSCWELSELLDR